MGVTVPNPVASSALARPAHLALVTPEASVTWSELRRTVARRAATLGTAGAGPGSIVTLPAPRDVAGVATLHAIGWLGACALPLAEDASRPPEATLALPGPVSEAPIEAPERFWPLEEPRVAVLTSGTTAAPRLVTLTTGQLCLSAFGSTARLGHDLADRWLCVLPTHHVGGLAILWRTAWLGTTTVLHSRFDAAAVSDAIDRGEATLVSLVPAMLDRVLDVRGARPFPETLRAILLGGAEAPPDLHARCRELRAPVATTWGMTEAASQVATSAPGEFGPGVGPPLPFARVSRAGTGALEVHGPLVPGGRFVTRDAGRVDDLGRVHVSGRLDDTIVSGGENIAPAEVEAALRSHPAVIDAAVVGVPDDRWGERPAAFVVACGEVTSEDLRRHCRATLAGFKVPDRVAFVAELPRNATGKLLRRALRDAHPEELP